MSPFIPVRYLAQNRHSVSVGWRAITWGTPFRAPLWEPSHMLLPPVFSRLFAELPSEKSFDDGKSQSTYTPRVWFILTPALPVRVSWLAKNPETSGSQPAARCWECPPQAWDCLFKRAAELPGTELRVCLWVVGPGGGVVVGEWERK